MEAAHELQRDAPDAGAAQTLGDVLYAGSGKSVEAEQAWARYVRDMAAGDTLALHALYERTHRVVFTLIMRITANRATAEELTVDVFYDAWRRAREYDPANGTVLGWILNQARSRAIDRLRFEQRKKRAVPDMEASAEPLHAPDSFQMLDAKQRAQALRAALAVLTAQERGAIEAAYFGELTYAEVAARLNEPLGTVKTRIRSALHKLREALAVRATRP